MENKNTQPNAAGRTKPKYNIFKVNGFCVQAAWQCSRDVPLLCLLLAAATAVRTALGMLISPALLDKLETGAPLAELLSTALLFTAALMAANAVRGYLDECVYSGRTKVRISMQRMLSAKSAHTAYPNTQDPAFLQLRTKAQDVCARTASPAQDIWRTWTELLANLLGFAFYLTILSGLDMRLLVLVVCTTIAGFAVDRQVQRWGYRHRDEEAEYLHRMQYIDRAAIQRTAGKDIRIFGLQSWLEDVWQSAMELYRGFLTRRERHYMLANISDLLLALARNGIAYFYLIRLTLANGLPASRFLLYFSALTGFTQWVTGILEKCLTLYDQSLDISAVMEFINWPEPFRFTGGKALKLRPDTPCELRLENVSFRYPEAKADTISHMNLTVHPGERLAIVGLNGAGKTTLVKLLAGFLDPTAGRVLLNGEDIRQYNRQEYYAAFSAVFQEFSVLAATVAENVAQTMSGIDASRVAACIEKAGLTDAVAALPKGADTQLNREVWPDGVELSGGQTQRLMLARALYKDAPILLLDEPTAALDPIAEDDIYRRYSRMTEGRTSVFISHRLASTRFCDRIIFLENGQIAEEGTHEALMAAGGKYAALFAVQSRYYQETAEEGEPDGNE